MQKLDNYLSNLLVLKRAKYEDLSNEFIISGIIDKFSIQFELGWKLFQWMLRNEGRIEGRSGSPRTIIKAAYQTFDFIDEEIWLLMLSERNNMTHIYDGAEALRLVDEIIGRYIPEFERVGDAATRHINGQEKEV